MVLAYDLLFNSDIKIWLFIEMTVSLLKIILFFQILGTFIIQILIIFI